MELFKIADAIKFELVKCPVCKATKYTEVYQCYQETGFAIGRIKTSFVVCNVCGFMYQNPRAKIDLIKKYYINNEESSGAVYHDMGSGSSNEEKQKSRIAFYNQFIGKLDGGSLLEVGCSTGEFLHKLGLADWKILGIEPSVKASMLAKEKGIEVICSSIEDVELPANSFDVVCCFSVIEHLSDIDSALEMMTRLIKYNGYLFAEVPDTMNPAAQIAEFFSFEHLSHFTRHTLTMFLKKFGYKEFIFDNNIKDSRIRICARKSNSELHHNKFNIASSWLDGGKYEYEQMIKNINTYKNTKHIVEKALKKRLSGYIQKWDRQKSRLAIYGAGNHTRYLLNLFDLTKNVVAILDSDPGKYGKNFLRWQISNATLLEKGRIDAVIISSKAFEDEIYRRIKKYEEIYGVEIVRCYDS
jgi:2-polyprenyl-3-methyl-5-hydroxy-6-metoxy-1,4-benzoquinol methylase